MIKLQFEKLDPVKLPLVQRFYKLHYPSARPKKNELIVVARHENRICAAVRFRPVEHYQLLTGMAVDEALRGQGVGRQLLTHCQQQILDSGVYCFAFTWLEGFYRQHNFTTLSDDKLPNSLQMLFQRYQNSGKALIAMQYCTDFS